MDALTLLSRTTIFQGFPTADLDDLARSAKPRTFARGSYIFHEGDPGSTMFVIREGQVKIARLGRSGEEVVFALLTAGDSFGELAVFDESGARTADAQAMTFSECLTLDRQFLLPHLESNPRFARRLVCELSRYIRNMDEAYSEAAFLDIPGRVARKLLELSDSHGEKTNQGTRIKMRLTQRTLAGMVAASRENVNRALSRLAARGDISQDGGFITIVRPAELRKRA